ncbi:MAG: methyltransferase domain-containing protein [Deltaproteobacteria bacterium]
MIESKEYDEYFVPGLFEPWARDLIRRAQVWKGDRVVDLACGTGIVACRIAGTGAAVIGVDASADQLARAKQRASDEAVPVTWLMRDFTSTTLKSASADLVTCQQGLQFATDRAAVVSEARRLLASGGRAVFSCWAELGRQDGFREVEAIATNYFGPGESAASSMTEAELRALFAKHFMAVQIETTSRLVRFPDPERFAHSLLAARAADRGATVDDAVVSEAIGAITPFVVEDKLELQSVAISAVGRVSAK